MVLASKTVKRLMFLTVLTVSVFSVFLISLVFPLEANAAENFKGSGTTDDPCIIFSADDLMRLAEEVNEKGNTFEGGYFAFENDIDMSGIDFTPIGVFDSGNYFYGTMDGRGHTIKNISINGSGNNGFFGALGGTVVNLEISGGSISGACCGVFSSHAASPEARILNCKSTGVTVNAARAGGIADNFAGTVINCVSEGCVLNGTDLFGGITSYEIRESCGNYYSFAENDNGSGSEVKADGSAELGTETADIQAAAEKLNNNYRYYSIFTENDAGMINAWEVSDNGRLKISGIRQSDCLSEGLKTVTGSGEKDDPYIISSADDLMWLVDEVNTKGNTFEGGYFAFENDIDMSGIDFTPIGVFDSGNYFYGTMDGRGHTIKNISINGSGNNGFFGALGGTVVNLEISGGSISGACCGVFSSHAASPEARILNCKSTGVTVNAARAGGIADNFAGTVINCVSEGCVLNGTDSFGGISSYDIREAYSNYYSLEAYSGDGGNEIKVYGSAEFKAGQADIQSITEKLNNNYRYYSIFPLRDFGICNIWRTSERGTPEISDIRQSDRFSEALKTLSGTGSKSDPYLVNTAGELVIIRDAVNSGCNFYNKYIRQTADIDLLGELWTPIGQMGSDNYFFGTYDGAGHTINNIHTITYGNNGFFGMLGGTVLNLGIESGRIEGNCCGAIASHSYSNYASVINCYNKADVVGNRAGGIVDNFSGSVIGCWSDCALKGEATGGISSYNVYIINYCLTSDGKIVAEENNKVSLEEAEEIASDANFSNVDFSADNIDEVVRVLNENMYGVKELSLVRLDLYQFAADESGILFSDEIYTYEPGSEAGHNMGPILYITFAAVTAAAAGVYLLLRIKFKDYCKDYIKRLLMIVCPVFLFFYMFFIHSPIEFFLVNNSELGFVLGDFVWKFIACAVVGTVVISALAALLKEKVCEIIACAVLGLDLCMYIQLNFMNGSLALLDGTENAVATTENYINLAIWAVLFLLPFGLFFVLKAYRKNIVMFLCAALSLMQITSITCTIVQSPESAFKRDATMYVLLGNDQFTVSADKNIIILSMDTYCNSYIDEFFETYPETADIVKDFTYYNNADCHYYPTVFSTYYLMSGTEFDMSVTIDEWCETAWDNERNNSFYSRMAEQGFLCNYYGVTFNWLSNKAKQDAAKKVSNLSEIQYECDINDSVMFGLFLNADMYRFSPGILKHKYEFDPSDYSSACRIVNKLDDDADTDISTENMGFYQDLLSERLKTDDSANYYILQHLVGLHPPFTTDEKCNAVTEATLLETERGCWRYIEEYLEQLKRLGVYDDAAIIITTDHGDFWTDRTKPSAQPIFFIKKPGEIHDKYVETNAPISFTDLMPTVMYLAGGEYSDLGTTVYEHTENEKRERVWYGRMYDKELPDVPKRGTSTKASYNCFYKYVYTGDGEDMRDALENGPAEKVLWTDAFY